MELNYRKINRVLHRDLGYFFLGMTIIYALSGIALNHLSDWNPSYSISSKDVIWEYDTAKENINEKTVLEFLETQGEKENYKKFYFPNKQYMKVFLKNGSVTLNLETGRTIIEKIERRPVFYQMNYLHYNPARVWTWFADIFCVALILIAITGLFIVKGKNGLRWRGAVLAAAGIIIPIGFLFFLL